MLADVVFRASTKSKGKTSDAADATTVGRQVTRPQPKESERPQLRFAVCEVEKKVAHVLILLQLEYVHVAAAAYGLGNGVCFCVIPLELYAVVLTKQVTCRDAIVRAVSDLDSAKQRSRQVKPAIKLAAYVACDFNILSGSSRKQKNEAQQRGNEGRFCIHGHSSLLSILYFFGDRIESVMGRSTV